MLVNSFIEKCYLSSHSKRYWKRFGKKLFITSPKTHYFVTENVIHNYPLIITNIIDNVTENVIYNDIINMCLSQHWRRDL